MPSLTSTDQAKLEHSLALAWKHLFGASLILHNRGSDTAGDDLVDAAWYVRHLLDQELKRGGHLRTRPRVRT